MVGILNLGHYDSIIYRLWDLSSSCKLEGIELFILTCIRHLQSKHSGRSEAAETRQGPWSSVSIQPGEGEGAAAQGGAAQDHKHSVGAPEQEAQSCPVKSGRFLGRESKATL